MCEWHDRPDGWGWFWMILMMAVFWVPLLVLLLWATGSLGRGTPPSGAPPREPSPDARELARQAYARGEIDRERFLQITADLNETARKEN